MTEAKTYYGPWLDSFPSDAPYGSLWEHRAHDGDIHRHYFTDEGSLSRRLANLSAKRIPGIAIRRVWPPGSVLPEPRPLVVNGDLRSDDDCHWMVKLSLLSPWICFDSLDLDYEMTDDLSRAVCYPVQPFNGAFVPVPWPDSGCTTK